MVVAEWSGAYPNLCAGRWKIIVNGKDVSDKIPDRLICNSMNTYGVYQAWHFNEYYMEEFEYYNDGLDRDDWIKENKEWLNKITTDKLLQMEIFDAIQSQDFRIGSCGGCI
jgi:hypothetical protein